MSMSAKFTPTHAHANSDTLLVSALATVGLGVARYLTVFQLTRRESFYSELLLRSAKEELARLASNGAIVEAGTRRATNTTTFRFGYRLHRGFFFGLFWRFFWQINGSVKIIALLTLTGLGPGQCGLVEHVLCYIVGEGNDTVIGSGRYGQVGEVDKLLVLKVRVICVSGIGIANKVTIVGRVELFERGEIVLQKLDMLVERYVLRGVSVAMV